MEVFFSFIDVGEEAEWTCRNPGFTTTDQLYVDLNGTLDRLNMPIAIGAVGQADGRDAQFIESITVTVIDRSLEP